MRPARLLLLSGLLSVFAVAPAAAGIRAADGDSFSVSSVAVTEAGELEREVSLEVRREGNAAPQRLAFRVPMQRIGLDERPAVRILDRKLLIHTDGIFAVFDLVLGRLERSEVVTPALSVTEDGRRLAWKADQPRFLPAEAASAVVRVIDIPMQLDRLVFPEREKTESSQSGHLLAWQDDPAQRCSAGDLFWSPEGDRLVFFCRSDLGELSLVLVDLRDGLMKSRFTRRTLPRESYLKPGETTESSHSYFQAEKVTWLKANRIEVEPPAEAPWLRDRIILDLPEPANRHRVSVTRTRG